MDFKDKVVLITGAARGIGKEIAIGFAKSGAAVCFCDLNEEAVKAAEEELASCASQVQGYVVNVTDFDQVNNMVNKILDKFNKIDILVNNAGITKDNLILRMKPEDWDAVLSVNLKGVFNATRAVSRAMIKKRGGKIINIASIIGLVGNAGQANYAASKAGIIGFTKSMAKELGSRNIAVNAIAPGYIKTEMTDKLPQDVKDAMLKRIPLGKFGSPVDVAELSLFLASSNADYITGQTIVIDGGMI